MAKHPQKPPLPPHKPGEALPGETPAPFAAFVVYRDASHADRDIGALAKKHGRAPGTWYRYSKAWRWRERAEEWDEELQRIRDEVIISDVEQMQIDHLQVLKLARTLGTTSLARHLNNSKGTKVPPADIKEALALIKETITLERLILGKATAREDKRIEVNVDDMSQDEGEQLLASLRRANIKVTE